MGEAEVTLATGIVARVGANLTFPNRAFSQFEPTDAFTPDTFTPGSMEPDCAIRRSGASLISASTVPLRFARVHKDKPHSPIHSADLKRYLIGSGVTSLIQ
jgi:hypothetical protein